MNLKINPKTIIGLTLISLTTAFVVSTASASATSPTVLPAASLRIANIGDKTGLVDLWVNSKLVAQGIDSKAASSYLEVGTGEQSITVFSQTSRFAPVVGKVNVSAGQKYTLALQDNGNFSPKLTTFAQTAETSSVFGKVAVNIYNVAVDQLSVLGANMLPIGESRQVYVNSSSSSKDFSWAFGNSSANSALSFVNVKPAAFANNASVFILDQTPDTLNRSPKFILL
jgi:hypothetical protein